MGKANRVKLELRDAIEMVDLLQTLKDIADNKYFTLISRKDLFKRFSETFVKFFRMISMTKQRHPLIENDNPNVGILVITAEGSFLGEFNNKILRLAFSEREKHKDSMFIAVGERCVDRLAQYTPDLKVFSDIERKGLYETAVEIKNYLVSLVMDDVIGKVMVCYSWPKEFETQKPKVVQLLPCVDLVAGQKQILDIVDTVIEESDPKEVIGFLSNLWITTRLYEILIDTIIAASAAQSHFLDDSVEKMKKEKRKTQIKFRKAKKNDIDKSLRETFSARMMTMQS